MANTLRITLDESCIELQRYLLDGSLRARGPIINLEATKIYTEFWRFARPKPDGTAYHSDFQYTLPWFEVAAKDVLRKWPPAAADSKKHPGGAPPILDWAAVESALEAECKLQESVPHRKHSDRHWRTKADAYRWVREEYLKRKGGGPSDTAMKTRVGPMLDRINERLQKVGN